MDTEQKIDFSMVIGRLFISNVPYIFQFVK